MSAVLDLFCKQHVCLLMNSVKTPGTPGSLNKTSNKNIKVHSKHLRIRSAEGIKVRGPEKARTTKIGAPYR